MAVAESTEANLRGYLQVLGRRIHWLLAVALFCVAVTVGFSSVQKKEYSSTAQLLVGPASGSVPISGTQATVSSTDVLTELQLMTSAPVEAQAAKKLGFKPNVTVAEVGQTNVVALTATGSSPIQAAHAANVYANTFVGYQRTNAINTLTAAEQQLQGQIAAIDTQIQTLEAQKSPTTQTTSTIGALSSQEAVLKDELAQLQVTGAETPGGVDVVSPAIAPSSPSSPKPFRDAVLALILGIVLGTGIAFAAEYFDRKVYTKDQVERLTGGVPVLAMIPKLKSWKKTSRPLLITQVDPFSPATEAYRALRTSLQFAGHAGAMKTVLITSASGSEGKTSTVANLGVVLAKAGERVAVVGCDLRRPRLGGFLGRGELPGFTSVLIGQIDLQRAMQPVPNTPGLALLGTGPIPPNPAEMLGSEKAAEIFRTLAAGFDIVLIDSPPLLPVADALVLAAYADAVLMVVTVGQTTEAEVSRASELLAQVNARPTGIVLNKIIRRSGNAGEHGYGYGYGYKYDYRSHTAPELMKTGNGNGNGLQPAAPARRSQHKTGS